MLDVGPDGHRHPRCQHDRRPWTPPLLFGVGLATRRLGSRWVPRFPACRRHLTLDPRVLDPDRTERRLR